MDYKKLIKEYEYQLSPQEKIAYDIALKHLGSSFIIEKTIGFKNWYEKYKNLPNNNNLN